MTSTVDPATALGVFLTGGEAGALADRLADGYTLTAALRNVGEGRRTEARRLLNALSDFGTDVVPVLRAVQGSRSVVTAVTPVWTMPGFLAQSGHLGRSVADLIGYARTSITCSTYNFQSSSALWPALRAAVDRPHLSLRIYVDGPAADRKTRRSSVTTRQIADHLRPAVVLRTRSTAAGPVLNHTKFIAVDHRFLLVTSANFSWQAENRNVEFGVLLDNSALAESVERQMRQAEGSLFEQVPAES